MKRLVLALALVACTKKTGELQFVDVRRDDLVIGVAEGRLPYADVAAILATWVSPTT